MKKIILAILVVVVVFAFTLPIYADKPDNPGSNGQAIKNDTQDLTTDDMLGVRAVTVQWCIDNMADVDEALEALTGNPEIEEFTNFGQVMKWCNYNIYGVPPAK